MRKKIGLQLAFGHVLDATLYTLEKHTPATVLAVGHNPKDIFQNRCQRLQSILCCPLQLVFSPKFPNSNIPKNVYSGALVLLLNMAKQLRYE